MLSHTDFKRRDIENLTPLHIGRLHIFQTSTATTALHYFMSNDNIRAVHLFQRSPRMPILRARTAIAFNSLTPRPDKHIRRRGPAAIPAILTEPRL
jgi:hypothetical protein